MASVNAKRAAVKMAEAVGRGELLDKGKILREVGYSRITSLTPTKVTNTKGFKDIMNPLVKRLDQEITRIEEAMLTKDLTEERYDTLTRALDTIVKNKQLLSGGDTERIGLNIEISSEIAKKNNIGK